jgi:hypothetical protein
VEVTVSGEVVHVPPGLPYAQDFSVFSSQATLPIEFSVAATGSATIKLDFSPWADGGNTNTGVKYSTTNANVLGSTMEVLNIGELRNQFGSKSGPVVYTITGEVILTLQGNYRNHKYIQDATGAILIDDVAGTITTTYDLGDGITGITGELSMFENMRQFSLSEEELLRFKLLNTSTPQHLNSSTPQHLNTSTPQLLNSSTPQLLNSLNTLPGDPSFSGLPR